jgi:hypothetical protein
MQDSKDLIAAYLAKGGKVRRMESGERAMTDRELYKAERGEAKDDNALIEERHVRAGVVYNGLGEYIGRV